MPDEPAVVLLIHGTFAYRDEDSEPLESGKPASWWQTNGDFCRALNDLLDGVAVCWETKACQTLTWAQRPWWERRLTAWAGHGLDVESFTRLFETASSRLNWNLTLRQQFRTIGRTTFAWSGANSDTARRQAGARLYTALTELENAGRPYHLVGHSHGGTVIWHALLEAAGRQHSLMHLRTWTTLGTPFPVYQAIRYCGLVGLLGFLMVGVAGWLAVGDLIPRLLDTRLGSPDERSTLALDLFLRRSSEINLFADGLSPVSAVLALMLAAGALWCLSAVVLWTVRLRQQLRDEANASAAWTRHRSTWLGLFSPLDEALSGTQSTVGFYVPPLVRLAGRAAPVPVPITRGDLFRFPFRFVGRYFVGLVAIMSDLVVMPLAEWIVSAVLRLKFQGADRLGTTLTSMDPEPVPHDPARGPLPPELADPLHHRVQQEGAATLLDVRVRFANAARSPLAPPAMFPELFGGLSPGRELVHNSYYDIDVLRLAVAAHILARADEHNDHHHSADALSAVRQALPTRTTQWLAAEPGPISAEPTAYAPPPPYRPAPKPVDSTPRWTRILQVTCVLALLALAVSSIRDDVRSRFVPYLLQAYIDTATGQGANATDADILARSRREKLRRALVVFRPLAEQSSLKLATGVQSQSRHLSDVASLFGTLDGYDPLKSQSIALLGRLSENPGVDPPTRLAARKVLLDPSLHANPLPAFDLTQGDPSIDQQLSAPALAVLAARQPAPRGIDDLLIRAAAMPALAPQTRVWILTALASTPPSVAAAQAAITALKDPDARIVTAAANALRQLGPLTDRVVPELLRSTKTPAVAHALISIGGPAVGPICDELIIGSDNFHLEILEAIGPDRMNPEQVDRVIKTTRDFCLSENSRPRGTDALSFNTDLIWSRSRPIAARLLATLARTQPDLAVPTLAKILDAADDDLRAAVLDSLARLWPASRGVLTVDRLRPLLGPKPLGLAAINALGALGPAAASAVPDLLALLKPVANPSNAYAQYNIAIITTLSRIGRPAIPALIAALDEEPPAFRIAVAQALGYIGADAKPALVETFRHGKLQARVAAADAMEYLGYLHKTPPAPPPAPAPFGSFARDVVPALVEGLSNPDPNVRHAAANALSWVRLDPDQAQTYDNILRHALADPDPRLSVQIAIALAWSGARDRAVSDVLKRGVERGWRDGVGDLAAAALARISDTVPGAARMVLAIQETDPRRPIRQALEASAPIESLREALGEVRTEVRPAFVDLFDRRKINSLEVLEQLGPKATAAAADIRALLRSTPPSGPNLALRIAAVRALARIEPGSAEAALLPNDILTLLQSGAEFQKSLTRQRLQLQDMNQPDTSGDEPGLGPSLIELSPLGSPVVPTLRDALLQRPELRPITARVLALIGPPAREAIPELLEILMVGDDVARSESLKAIAAIARPSPKRSR